MVKEFRMLRSVTSQSPQLVNVPRILGVGLYRKDVAHQISPGCPGEAPSWVMFDFTHRHQYGDILIALFIVGCYAQLCGFNRAVSQGGRNIWMIKAAPVSSGRLLRQKSWWPICRPWRLAGCT